MPPELKLLLLVSASASAFHFSKSHLSKMPGQVASQIPSAIVNKLVNNKPPPSQFMSEQELHIERMKQELREKERLMKEQLRQPPQQQNSMFNVPTNLQSSHHPINFDVNTFAPGGPPNPLIQNKPNITQSESVKNVLSRLHSRDNDTAETQEETSTVNDRLLSDTLSDGKKKTGKKQPKKSLMSVY